MHDIRELVASRFYVQELYTWECIYEIRRPTEVVLEGLRFDWFGQLNAMRVNASNVFSNADMALDTPVPKKYRSGPLAVPIYGIFVHSVDRLLALLETDSVSRLFRTVYSRVPLGVKYGDVPIDVIDDARFCTSTSARVYFRQEAAHEDRHVGNLIDFAHLRAGVAADGGGAQGDSAS